MEKIKEILERLAKSRKVNDAFIERLKKVGFKIEYGAFAEWNSGCEYIQIRKERIFLVERYVCNNTISLRYRKQIDVIKEIIAVITEEYKNKEQEDENINNFFKKLKNN